MRALILLLMLLPALALGGSGYTPPASGGGVSGDGTGVSDASAFRTALGLGTAATAASTSFASASSAHAADVWDYEWNASAVSTMEADGWTKTGSITDTSTTIGSYTARLLTPTANSGAAYMSKVIVTNSGGLAPVTGLSVAGPFELRVLLQMPASTSNNIVHAFAFCMQAGGNQFIPAVTSTAFWASGGTGTLTSLTLTGGLPNRSIWITIRAANGISSGTSAATSYTEMWAGGARVWSGVSTTPWASFTGGSEGLLRIGRIVGPGSGGNVEAVRVASIKWRAGWNAAPVDYSMRALNGAVGP